MADSVIVRITENRLVVTKEDKKVSVAAPYVKYVYTLGEDGGGVPAIATGDAGKVLTVKSDESGTEWTTPSSGSSSGVSLGLVIALT